MFNNPNIFSLILVSIFSLSKGYKASGTIVKSSNFNAITDAQTLNTALAGFGTKDKVVIGVICGRTNYERQLIASEYNRLFGRSLHKHIASDTSGNYGDLMDALMVPSAEFDASLIKKSIKGFGTDFELLIEVMLTRTPRQMAATNQAYSALYKKDMADDIKGDVNRDVQDLLVRLIEGKRDQSNTVNLEMAKKDAQSLNQAGLAKIGGTNMEVFINILTTRNYEQLAKTFEEYEILTKVSMEKTIESEMSGKIKTAFLVLVECIQSPSGFFARKLHKALKKGILGGTNEEALIRIFVTRSEVDMVQIKQDYQKIYKTPLETHLRHDVSRYFQDALVALLQGNRKN
ncbi:unnamed protein product [Gordionus sp. m RMFG-2023]|uniref:annexin A13-like isoform X2 n=1 Tax=Gordionus sp. m RMFG-2023 TaxID=3053472 RepID=UPI0030E56717